MYSALEEFVVGTYVALAVTFHNLDMKDWAAAATISWILIQVNERRRLNERNIDKFLDRGLKEKLRNLREERARSLSRFTKAAGELPILRAIKMVYANVRRLLSFCFRILRLRRPQASMSHAMILFDGGNKDGARREFRKLANELLEKAELYRKYASAKDEEAMNALIYCGRVAALQKKSDATIEAFNKVLTMNEKDPDARKLIGEQFRAAGNPTEALRQFSAVVESMGKSPQAAEALRLQAEIYSENDEVGKARDVLKKSLAIERERQSYSGIAETEEKLGDVFASRERTISAAKRSYLASIENYRTASQPKGIRRVRAKLRKLLSDETLLCKIDRTDRAFHCEVSQTVPRPRQYAVAQKSMLLARFAPTDIASTRIAPSSEYCRARVTCLVGDVAVRRAATTSTVIQGAALYPKMAATTSRM